MYPAGGDGDGGEGGGPGPQDAEPADWRKPLRPWPQLRPEDSAKVRPEGFWEVPESRNESS